LEKLRSQLKLWDATKPVLPMNFRDYGPKSTKNIQGYRQQYCPAKDLLRPDERKWICGTPPKSSKREHVCL